MLVEIGQHGCNGILHIASREVFVSALFAPF